MHGVIMKFVYTVYIYIYIYIYTHTHTHIYIQYIYLLCNKNVRDIHSFWYSSFQYDCGTSYMNEHSVSHCWHLTHHFFKLYQHYHNLYVCYYEQVYHYGICKQSVHLFQIHLLGLIFLQYWFSPIFQSDCIMWSKHVMAWQWHNFC